ncbi:thermonuclease family protein [Jeotgalibacillus sp. ET6]|uniref:thermonuclease family protein n=1 Tax=Jeotgalibacillus sp. ET6 TaxID=3037260 RepID=UPI002418B987|nr:thermonuclease family protein [Jeotgalibacillus sp. ET6]MDG5470407.1 thermonuclease family protein [Jeotgalibacillus sp. ET6]
MKKMILICFLLLLAGCTADQDDPYINAQVINIVDGDTIDVRMSSGAEERIRLLLIDTPETKHPQLGVQPFGKAATAYTEESLLGKFVKLEMDISDRDRYGRVLAYVWIDDTLFNEELIRQGLARVAVYPPDIKYADRFKKVQSQAREEEAGIWSIENYAADDGFDPHSIETSEKETQTKPGCTIKGNINSNGGKIYHDESSRYYTQTIAEKWFCTPAEAEKAGFRAPKN